MSYIQQVMDEEHRRLEALSKKYRDIIGSFPRGTASVKKRKGREYLYLARRVNGKVAFDYVGSLSSDKAREVLDRINERKSYEAKLNQVNRDLKDLGKILHGRKL